MKNNKTSLIQLFVKAPVAGKVKTRLAKTVGNERAAEIAVLLFNEMLTRCVNVTSTECWIAGNPIINNGLELCEELSVPRFTQPYDVSLGERMTHAMRGGLDRAKRTLIVGSDCLGVTEELAQKALDALDEHDQVFIPAEDGGFVLWGARVEPDPLQFSTIEWGMPDVWQRTQERLCLLNVNYCALEPSWDVDEAEDLERVAHLL